MRRSNSARPFTPHVISVLIGVLQVAVHDFETHRIAPGDSETDNSHENHRENSQGKDRNAASMAHECIPAVNLHQFWRLAWSDPCVSGFNACTTDREGDWDALPVFATLDSDWSRPSVGSTPQATNVRRWDDLRHAAMAYLPRTDASSATTQNGTYVPTIAGVTPG
jgi:hypothetical protein